MSQSARLCEVCGVSVVGEHGFVRHAAGRAHRVWVNGKRVESAFDPTLGVILFEVPNSPEVLRVKWL